MSQQAKDPSLLLELEPIGIIRTSMRTKFDAPHQPSLQSSSENIIELFPKHSYKLALQDLDGFERIWIISWFHRNSTWNPLVLPPRGEAKRRGVFATRSPHRPNPIGLTATTLLRINDSSLVVGEVDLIDGTPILDIKPYISSVDAFPHSAAGWVDELEKQLGANPRYDICCSEFASEQLKWLSEKHSIDFMPRAEEILSRDPRPHRTRRISKRPSGFMLGCGAWRLYFEVESTQVKITRISPGYPSSYLGDSSLDIPDCQAQIEFLKIWPET